MEIAIRYMGTASTTGISSFAVFANGFRVGFIKNSGTLGRPWRAVRWNYAFLGDYQTDFQAVRAVLVFYKNCKPKKLIGFKRKALKLEQFQEHKEKYD